MSGWGGLSGRKTGLGRPLQFVVPSAPAVVVPASYAPASSVSVKPEPTPAPAVENDDDIWGEDISEELLEEAILMDSQYLEPNTAAAAKTPVTTKPPADTRDDHVWEDVDLEEEKAPATGAGASVATHTAAEAGLQNRIEQLHKQNDALQRQVEKAGSDKLMQQGEVAVLRSELAKRARDVEALRLDHQHRLEEQRTEFLSTRAELMKNIDALKSDLQFKVHELAEASRQCRELRGSPQQSQLRPPAGSPPRKVARLGASPELRKRFITRSDFQRLEGPAVARESASTQTEERNTDDLDCSEPAASRLVAEVLACFGDEADTDCLPGAALSALARLANGDAGAPAAVQLADAAVAACCEYLTAAEQLQTVTERDSRSCTLRTGRQRWSSKLRLLRLERRCVAVLSALARAAEWRQTQGTLTTHAKLTELLPKLLQPVVVQGEVHNQLMMEYAAALVASMAVAPLPEPLLRRLEPAVNDALNTKPPMRVLQAVLELLTCVAGSGQAAVFTCQTSREKGAEASTAGTCFLRKLVVLFSDCAAGAVFCAPARSLSPPVTYSLPVGRRPRPAAHTKSTAALRGELRPPELVDWKVTTGPALACLPLDQWLHLVTVLLGVDSSAPTQPCCRGNLTVLVVHLLHSVVSHCELSTSDLCASSALWGAQRVGALLSALYRLSDLDGHFSASVSRARHHYQVAMQTLARTWRHLRLSPAMVGVLQELYKFDSDTFHTSESAAAASAAASSS